MKVTRPEANGSAPSWNVPSVKYFVGVITNRPELLDPACQKLTEHLGPIDYTSEWFLFDFTNFYEAEMGADLKRCFVSFEKTISPEMLPQTKEWTNEIEDEFRSENKRQVNLDPGYLDFYKVILASNKVGGHKIAVTRECYADMIMDYRKGAWHPFPWCFPDFKTGRYDQVLTEIRNIYKDRQSTY